MFYSDHRKTVITVPNSTPRASNSSSAASSSSKPNSQSSSSRQAAAAAQVAAGAKANAAQSVAQRKDRIIDVAIRLAEEGGFENVRQRDVAKQSGVALGTLYKSFKSKEDILAAALQRETDMIEQKLERRPAKGETAPERLGTLFQMLTRTILRKPNYARAVLRAMTSGEEVAQKVVSHQVKVTRMVIAAMRGTTPTAAFEEDAPTESELQVAMMLQNLWFAALVGWSAKLHGQARIVEQMRHAAELLIKGAEL